MALVGNISGSGGISNTIGITGSLIVANPGTAVFPTFPGNDVTLFVSGNIASKPATSPDLTKRGTTVFGGDVVISGTLFGGSPLHIGTFLSASQGAEIGGAVTFTSTTAPSFNNGLSGSLTKLADGTSYLIAGSNITIATGTNGAVTISSTAAGGGSNFFSDTDGNGQIFTTGSTAFVGSGADYVNNIKSPADKGSDLFFYVSGSTAAGSDGALFGGRLIASGNLIVKDSSGAAAATLTNDGNVSITGNIDTVAAGAKTLFPSAGANTVTIGGATSTVVAAGTLQVNGSITTDTDEAKSIFTGVTTQTVTIGGAGSTVAVDTLTVGGGYGSTGVTVSSVGAIQANGNLTVDGTSTLTGNVTIAGDLTVNGTTTTIDTTNLLVEDPIIYFGSGSVGVNRNGGIALASGSSVTHQALVWGRVDTNTWGAGRKDVTNGTETDLTTMVLQPVRASKFEVGGVTAFVTSALGSEITVKTTGGDVNLDAASGAAIDILFNGTQAGAFSGTGAASLNLFARDAGPATTARALTLSGSSVTIGSHTQTTNFAFAGNNVGVASNVGGFTVGANPGLNLSVSGSQIFINSARGTSGGGATFQADGSNILAIQSGSINGQLIIGPGPGMTRTDLINTDSTTVNFAGAATTLEIGATTGTTSINNSLTVDGNTTLGNATGDNITFTGRAASSLIPNTNNAYDLGQPDLRWRNMYTGDLHLRNDRGDWTIIEEREFLSITNNHTGRRYKFLMEEI